LVTSHFLPRPVWHHGGVLEPQARSTPVDARPAARWHPHLPGNPEISAYVALALISLGFSLYLSWHLLGGLPSRMIAGDTGDIRLFTWYLENDSVSVLHGHDPLFFTTMNAPAGVNGMWNPSILLPALVMTPVTLLAGPLAACNALFVLGLATGPPC
jgi:hypothetical protein